MKSRVAMRFVYISCCLVFLGLLWPNAAVEAQTPLWDTMIVAVSPNSPPFIDETSDGSLVGFDVDILKNLVRLADLQVRYEKTNFSYIVPGVASQLYDTAVGCLFINETRRKMVNFTNPYFTTGLVLVVQASNATIQTVNDLTPALRVSLKQGTAAEEYARQQTQARVQPVLSAGVALQQVVERSADAAIVDEMIAKAFMQIRTDIPLRIVGFLTREQCAFPVNKNDPALLAQLNQALVRLKNSRQYANLYRKWFGNRPTTVEPMAVLTPTVTASPATLTTAQITTTAQSITPVTPTKQWAGVYYLTAKLPLPDATTTYQLVTLTPDGIWSGTEMRQSSETMPNTATLSGTDSLVTQQGAWQADLTGNITATVLSFTPLSFQPPTVNPARRGLQRLQYKLKLDTNGAITGQYTRTPYRLGDDPLAATLPNTQTQTLSVTGQKVKP